MPGFELAEWLPFGSLSISGVSVSSLGPSDLALMTTFLETFAPNAHPHRHPCRRVDDFSPRSRLARYPPWEPAPVARQHPVCQSPRRQECSLRTLGDASWHEASWDGVPVTLQDPVSASALHGQWRCSVQRTRAIAYSCALRSAGDSVSAQAGRPRGPSNGRLTRPRAFGHGE